MSTSRPLPGQGGGPGKSGRREWPATDWLGDVIPHLAYGALTAAVLDDLDPATPPVLESADPGHHQCGQQRRRKVKRSHHRIDDRRGPDVLQGLAAQ